MPVVTDAGDRSQDALVVRVSAGGLTGWGECEASPLVSIAAYVTPMSHGACAGCRSAREKGFRAVKCGWGPFGRGSLSDDRDHLQAAREGLGTRARCGSTPGICRRPT